MKGRPFSGIDPEILPDLVEFGASRAAEAGVRFADWSAQVVAEFGESIRKYLPELWDRVRSHLGMIRRMEEQGLPDSTIAEAIDARLAREVAELRPAGPRPAPPPERPVSPIRPIPQRGQEAVALTKPELTGVVPEAPPPKPRLPGVPIPKPRPPLPPAAAGMEPSAARVLRRLREEANPEERELLEKRRRKVPTRPQLPLFEGSRAAKERGLYSQEAPPAVGETEPTFRAVTPEQLAVAARHTTPSEAIGPAAQ